MRKSRFVYGFWRQTNRHWEIDRQTNHERTDEQQRCVKPQARYRERRYNIIISTTLAVPWVGLSLPADLKFGVAPPRAGHGPKFKTLLPRSCVPRPIPIKFDRRRPQSQRLKSFENVDTARTDVRTDILPVLLRGVYSDTTQLNSTSSCRHVHNVNCHLSMNVVTQLTQFAGRDCDVPVTRRIWMRTYAGRCMLQTVTVTSLNAYLFTYLLFCIGSILVVNGVETSRSIRLATYVF